MSWEMYLQSLKRFESLNPLTPCKFWTTLKSCLLIIMLTLKLSPNPVEMIFESTDIHATKASMNTNSNTTSSLKKLIKYLKISHSPSPETRL